MADHPTSGAINSLVVCFGEMLIDFVSSVSGVSLAEAPAFDKAPGGAPANVAVGVSKLGASSAFIGKVGDDQFGHMLADILKENGVNNSGMRFDRKARTALAFVSLKSNGERGFLFFRNPSADMLLQESELDVNLLKQWISRSSIQQRKKIRKSPLQRISDERSNRSKKNRRNLKLKCEIEKERGL